MNILSLPPLSLYVHLPWCIRKCPYCDFNSHAADQVPEQAYLQALLQDLTLDLPLVQGRSLGSIFFGGGTPSLMSADFYLQLLKEIESRIPFSSAIEITLEANPGTFEQHRFAGYRNAGINRLSLGIQSFSDDMLKKLGRIHSRHDACSAIMHLRDCGFDNFNLDLMHGLPGQNVGQAMADLETAFAFSPNHISWYQLTLEPNTEFYRRPPKLPNDDTLCNIQEAGHHMLEQAGYVQYEVSAYAKPGCASRHNLNYWEFGDYLGIGAGAHGKISWPDGRIQRYRKTRQPNAYLQRRDDFLAETSVIATEDLPLEFLMNALRLKPGVTENSYTERTGQPLASLEPALSLARERQLIYPDRLQCTDKGFRYLNQILDLFL
ncbi:MAG: radical SAM family heme chaperone HemW [Hahellaceae bacterium]|nr:radical SAM family heme chaperone HemW [Hahellaceae bacterium]MCP5168415.1 radical SAM family heme chaperone HemW [Hahellaceae bacterium]